LPRYHFSKFQDALHKLLRARHHVEHLRQIVGAYIASLKPDFQFDETTGLNSIELVVPNPPDELPPVLGDAIHNLSSALDCISSQLIASKTGNWNRRVSFPIHETLAELKRSFETYSERPCQCGKGMVVKKGGNADFREHAPEFEQMLIERF
jgi:hypothetical protein